eukprot:s1102_g2.t1
METSSYSDKLQDHSGRRYAPSEQSAYPGLVRRRSLWCGVGLADLFCTDPSDIRRDKFTVPRGRGVIGGGTAGGAGTEAAGTAPYPGRVPSGTQLVESSEWSMVLVHPAGRLRRRPPPVLATAACNPQTA